MTYYLDMRYVEYSSTVFKLCRGFGAGRATVMVAAVGFRYWSRTHPVDGGVRTPFSWYDTYASIPPLNKKEQVVSTTSPMNRLLAMSIGTSARD